jgi:hypothetical protein
MDKPAPAPTMKVNGRAVAMALDKGYVAIDRSWAAGDVIELNLPMPVRRIGAHPKVEADKDRVALQRGPVVFAAEWPDNPGGKVRNIVLPDTAALTSQFRADLLNGVQVVTSRAYGLSEDARGGLEKHEQPFVAIPYATWANRGRGQMAVWLARTDAAAHPTPYPTVASTSTLTHSPSRKNIKNIIDGEDPASSDDPTAYFDWWPRNGCGAGQPTGTPQNAQQPRCSAGEWIEMTFAKPSSVSEAQVYWFDDTGHGGVRVPQSWRLLYKEGDTWKPVAASGEFGVARNRYNVVHFTPVTTAALRLELVMQPNVSAGVQEWIVK